MNLLDHVMQSTTEYIGQMGKTERKKYGQFFTGKETARFMAGLLTIPEKKEISVLDPGAGSGILSMALLERLQHCPAVEKIHLVCYENDEKILGLLQNNLEWAEAEYGGRLAFTIIEDNYILRQEPEYNNELGANPHPPKFDLIIGNPPYKKIGKNTAEANAMQDVCYGAPNLYFLFAAMSLFNLKENGEMVYIIPRSWTSGAYFRKFREKLLAEGVLEHIHLFASRNKVFENEDVLQETMIVKIRKTKEKPLYITITTTQDSADFASRTSFSVPYDIIVSGNEEYVYLVTSQREVQVLQDLKKWGYTLPEIGLKMKTGLTVDFRNREDLRDKEELQTVPLFYSQHIRDGKIHFPTGKGKEYLVARQSSLLQDNSNYLFVKRFTAKEEKRRLQCGVYLARRFPSYRKISTQNKINFICGRKSLSECVVYGLYVLFNSTVYDTYYRILNGSTQVNSTEVNAMPVPDLPTIEAMGKQMMREKDMSQEHCDKILEAYL